MDVTSSFRKTYVYFKALIGEKHRLIYFFFLWKICKILYKNNKNLVNSMKVLRYVSHLPKNQAKLIKDFKKDFRFGC